MGIPPPFEKLRKEFPPEFPKIQLGTDQARRAALGFAGLELIVDPSLLKNDEIYFNAARLDRSMALKTSDYVAVSKPRLEKIAASL